MFMHSYYLQQFLKCDAFQQSQANKCNTNELEAVQGDFKYLVQWNKDRK